MDRSTNMPYLEPTNIPYRQDTNPHFSWYDYSFLLVMLAISGGLGIFFGLCRKKQFTTTDYLLAGRNMKAIPVAMSLVAE